jgi:hypothetical protein
MLDALIFFAVAVGVILLVNLLFPKAEGGG